MVGTCQRTKGLISARLVLVENYLPWCLSLQMLRWTFLQANQLSSRLVMLMR